MGPLDRQRELVDAAHRVAERGLVWASAGNISARLDDDHFLISASGQALGQLTTRDLVTCHVSSDSYAGEKRPSTETPMHRAIYRARPMVQAILHTASFYATLMSCTGLDVPTDITPEAMGYLGAVARVPYHHPGSDELAQAAAASMAESEVLLLANHGPLCAAPSLAEAILRAETLEQLCHLLVCESMSQGTLRLARLGEERQEDFRARLYHRREI